MTGKFVTEVQSCLPGSTPSVLPLRVKPPAPHSVANATSLPGRGESVQGDGFSGGGKVSGIAKRRPLGGAGCERSEQTEGVIFYEPTCENGMPERLQTLRHSQSFYLCALPHQLDEYVHLRGHPFVPVVEQLPVHHDGAVRYVQPCQTPFG